MPITALFKNGYYKNTLFNLFSPFKIDIGNYPLGKHPYFRNMSSKTSKYISEGPSLFHLWEKAFKDGVFDTQPF